MQVSKNILFSHFNLENFLAKFGRIFEVVNLLFSFISTVFNNNSFDTYIHKRFKNKIIKNPELISEIENLLLNDKINLEDNFMINNVNKKKDKLYETMNIQNNEIKSVKSSQKKFINFENFINEISIEMSNPNYSDNDLKSKLNKTSSKKSNKIKQKKLLKILGNFWIMKNITILSKKLN